MQQTQKFAPDISNPDVSTALNDLLASIAETDDRMLESDIYFESSTVYAEVMFRFACLGATGEAVPTTFDCPADTPEEMMADSQAGGLRDQVVYQTVCIRKFTTPYPSTAAGSAGDLDCSDLPGSVWVGDHDPNGLDADGDGVGCD